MSLSNLPPGVSDYDIPGNRMEDAEWDRLIEDMMNDIDSPYEARQVWVLGLKSHNTQMHVDKEPCGECEKEKKNYPWPPFCKWCGRALRQ